MHLRCTSCCGVQELCGIYGANPEYILASIYQKGQEDLKKIVQAPGFTPKKICPYYGQYMFTGWIGYRKRRTPEEIATDARYFVGFSTGPVALAKYIREHGLGHITEAPMALNRKNCPTHKIKLWIWNVRPDRFQKWWDALPPHKRANFQVLTVTNTVPADINNEPPTPGGAY